MSMITLLNERHATRHLDPNVTISQAELSELVQAASRAPSGFNSQPWKVVALTEKAQKEKLFPLAFNQQQVLDASAVLIVLADRQAYQPAAVENLNNTMVEQGFLPAKLKDQMIGITTGFYDAQNDVQTEKFLALDVGLFAMSFMLVAQEKGWNTSPMIGYARDAVREAFAISDNYEDVLLIAVGKQTQVPYPSYRYPAETVISRNESPKK
ncbi:nitroreductase family protein [Glaesserella sp.]|uniref:nitroreductase family protein n=1 Tax=Glaesserella sp. TaxID=2094731 RepID=UPI0035A1A07E